MHPVMPIRFDRAVSTNDPGPRGRLLHVLEAALIGAHVATMPFKVMIQLAQHPLTDIGLNKFLEDWKKVPQNKIV